MCAIVLYFFKDGERCQLCPEESRTGHGSQPFQGKISPSKSKHHPRDLDQAFAFTCFSTLISRFHRPQSELDETQIQAAADDVELPTELAKMIAEDNQEEESKQSVLGQLTNIQNVDIDQIKEKAQSTLEDLKHSAEKCEVM